MKPGIQPPLLWVGYIYQQVHNGMGYLNIVLLHFINRIIVLSKILNSLCQYNYFILQFAQLQSNLHLFCSVPDFVLTRKLSENI